MTCRIFFRFCFSMSFFNSTFKPPNIFLVWSGKHVVQYLEMEKVGSQVQMFQGWKSVLISGLVEEIFFFLNFSYSLSIPSIVSFSFTFQGINSTLKPSTFCTNIMYHFLNKLYFCSFLSILSKKTTTNIY